MPENVAANWRMAERVMASLKKLGFVSEVEDQAATGTLYLWAGHAALDEGIHIRISNHPSAYCSEDFSVSPLELRNVSMLTRAIRSRFPDIKFS